MGKAFPLLGSHDTPVECVTLPSLATSFSMGGMQFEGELELMECAWDVGSK
jgi:hypothetical protein